MARPKSTSAGNVYIFSTLANDQKYQNYEINSGIAMAVGSVFIKGGTNVADSRIETPLGIMTQINDDDYALLQQNPDFNLHVKNGFIIVQMAAADPEKIAADMNLSDESRPLTEGDSRMQMPDDMSVTTNQG